ncbi:MinD/ParA family protein [Bacillus massiliglaciei]|uniref:MinD/ParA family protein n=1 Tax=Bacillus massiliglaciei TaxID=1816693 RepID=UPI000A913725|nr:MinD/ParA family protein [Bacillus massiliglaciei]
MDQAEKLRQRFALGRKRARTLAVASGKGGVGKSNFSLNFALSLAQKKERVLLFDMDIGMGNIDILLGEHSSRSIIDFFEKDCSLEEIMSYGPEGISIINGGSGLTQLFSLDETRLSKFSSAFSFLEEKFDYIIFDMGAGITNDSVKFLLCVDELIVVSTPEPTSVMDAYSVMKYIHSVSSSLPFYLVCNRAKSPSEGRVTAEKLKSAMHKFLQKDVTALGFLPDDEAVGKAVINQIPFLLFKPEAAVSRAMSALAEKYRNRWFQEEWAVPKGNFLQKLKSLFSGGNSIT